MIEHLMSSSLSGDHQGCAAGFIRLHVRGLRAKTVRMMTTNQIGNISIERQPAMIPDQSAEFPVGSGKNKFGLGFQITMTDGAASNERGIGSYTWAGIYNTISGSTRRTVLVSCF